VATEVLAPDGARWRVRRRWLGGRSLPRWRGMRGGDVGDSVLDLFGSLGGDNILGTIAFVAALAAAVALLVFFLLPLAILLVELLVFLLLVALGIAARVLLRRPWLLEADDGVMTRRWVVSGWRASQEALAEIAAALERGDAQVLPSAAVASAGPGRR
jgi:hypothetical protein